MTQKTVIEVPKEAFEAYTGDIKQKISELKTEINELKAALDLTKPIFNKSEAAAYCKIAESTFDKIRSESNIPFTKVGGPRFKKSDVIKMMEGYKWP